MEEVMMKRIVGALVALSLAIAVLPAGAADKVSLPKGYEKWEKSKEKVVNDKKSLFYGIHYIYVDKKAMKAYKAGGAYPEGSRFVVVFYNIKDEGGKPTKGKKNMVVLMEKNKKQQETGGWLFAGFNADGKPSGVDPVKNCFECHLKEAKATDFVLSKYADFK
jgi:Cytochrome P460